MAGAARPEDSANTRATSTPATIVPARPPPGRGFLVYISTAMSAYRTKPPPPRWLVLYQRPRAVRAGRAATLGLFGAITLGGLALAALGPIVDSPAGFALIPLGLLLAVTSGAFLGIVWATRRAFVEERTIDAVSAHGGGDSRCRVLCDGEAWTLPLDARKVHAGQTIRVRFREIAPQDDVEPGREILDVRVRED